MTCNTLHSIKLTAVLGLCALIANCGSPATYDSDGGVNTSTASGETIQITTTVEASALSTNVAVAAKGANYSAAKASSEGWACDLYLADTGVQLGSCTSGSDGTCAFSAVSAALVRGSVFAGSDGSCFSTAAIIDCQGTLQKIAEIKLCEGAPAASIAAAKIAGGARETAPSLGQTDDASSIAAVAVLGASYTRGTVINDDPVNMIGKNNIVDAIMRDAGTETGGLNPQELRTAYASGALSAELQTKLDNGVRKMVRLLEAQPKILFEAFGSPAKARALGLNYAAVTPAEYDNDGATLLTAVNETFPPALEWLDETVVSAADRARYSLPYVARQAVAFQAAGKDLTTFYTAEATANLRAGIKAIKDDVVARGNEAGGYQTIADLGMTTMQAILNTGTDLKDLTSQAMLTATGAVETQLLTKITAGTYVPGAGTAFTLSTDEFTSIKTQVTIVYDNKDNTTLSQCTTFDCINDYGNDNFSGAGFIDFSGGITQTQTQTQTETQTQTQDNGNTTLTLDVGTSITFVSFSNTAVRNLTFVPKTNDAFTITATNTSALDGSFGVGQVTKNGTSLSGQATESGSNCFIVADVNDGENVTVDATYVMGVGTQNGGDIGETITVTVTQPETDTCQTQGQGEGDGDGDGGGGGDNLTLSTQQSPATNAATMTSSFGNTGYFAPYNNTSSGTGNYTIQLTNISFAGAQDCTANDVGIGFSKGEESLPAVSTNNAGDCLVANLNTTGEFSFGWNANAKATCAGATATITLTQGGNGGTCAE
jgi:hypothetical protein